MEGDDFYTFNYCIFGRGKNDKNHLRDELVQGNDLYKSLWNPMNNDDFPSSRSTPSVNPWSSP